MAVPRAVAGEVLGSLIRDLTDRGRRDGVMLTDTARRMLWALAPTGVDLANLDRQVNAATHDTTEAGELLAAMEARCASGDQAVTPDTRVGADSPTAVVGSAEPPPSRPA